MFALPTGVFYEVRVDSWLVLATRPVPAKGCPYDLERCVFGWYVGCLRSPEVDFQQPQDGLGMGTLLMDRQEFLRYEASFVELWREVRYLVATQCRISPAGGRRKIPKTPSRPRRQDYPTTGIGRKNSQNWARYVRKTCFLIFN